MFGDSFNVALRAPLGSVAFAAILAVSLPCTAYSSPQTYTPVDPAFGGSPFNGSYLLGVASAINGYHDPAATTNNDPAALFVQELQGQLLGALAGQITNAIFGANAAPTGKIVFGDQSIAYARGLTSVDLTITNTATGAITQISVPILQNGTTGAGG